MNRAFAAAILAFVLSRQSAAQGPSTSQAGREQGAQNRAVGTKADGSLQRFVQGYYNAVTHHDKPGLRALVYSQSLACVDLASKMYFDQELSLFPKNVATSAATAKQLGVGEAKTMAAAIGAKLPAEADLFVTIDWKETAGRETRNHPSTMALKNVDGRYLEMIPCPSAAEIQSRNAFFQARK